MLPDTGYSRFLPVTAHSSRPVRWCHTAPDPPPDFFESVERVERYREGVPYFVGISLMGYSIFHGRAPRSGGSLRNRAGRWEWEYQVRFESQNQFPQVDLGRSPSGLLYSKYSIQSFAIIVVLNG